jgi:hypothetical protein
VVLCAQKSQPDLGVDCPVSQDATGGRLCDFVTGANTRVNGCGRPFHPPTARGIARRDFWAAYQAVIPDEQHTAVGKEAGETVHVERWNNTLRQRLARLVRMTLSFSKSVVMHEACLLLFLHRYNRERATLLK